MEKKTTPSMSRIALGGLAALAAALVATLALGAASAAAATPCWKVVLNDWFVDGRIDGIYAAVCYTQAEKHLGEDAKIYSTLPADLRRGLLASLAAGKAKAQKHEQGQTGPASTNGSGGGGGGGGGSGGGGPASTNGGGSGSSSPGFLTRAIRAIGPSNATSIPTPLLVLGGVAILLLLAALVSWVARRYQTRRLKPAPATPPQAPKRS